VVSAREPISVVVPTKDRPDFLTRCLAALRAALGPGDELIVADSASVDPRVKEVATDAGAVYVRCEEPGAARARNAGWLAARNEIVAFIDDDVSVDRAWAGAVAEAFARDPAIVFITGRIGLRADQANAERPVALLDDPDPARLDSSSRGSIGHSANMAVRRDVLEQIGGFDELLGAGAPLHAAEDYDVFDRLFAAGRTGAYEPAASAVHDQWRTRRQLLGLEWRYGIGIGARIGKLIRSDRRRARAVAREHLLDHGVGRAAKSLKSRYEFDALLSMVHFLGVVVGCARALTYPVRDGHLRRRRARSIRASIR
jgi:GT2 family glycosyltransferase